MGIKHPSHEHRLAPCEKEGEVSCGDCKQLIHGSAYGCDQEDDCSYFLHLSCTKFHHPLHPIPEHPLAPSEVSIIGCDVCGHDNYKRAIFACDLCRFYLCEDCVSLEPCVVFECEQGLFVLVAAKSFLLLLQECRTCGKEADHTMIFKRVHPLTTGVLHVHCVPFDLPKSVEHPSHHHPLAFTEKYFDPDIIGCYCDICENERDPKSPVYHCSECKFSAHAGCALSKVLPSLTTEWRAGGHGGGDSVPKSETETETKTETKTYHDQIEGELMDLFRSRDSLRSFLEPLTQKLKTVEEEYGRYLAFAGQESGRDDHDHE